MSTITRWEPENPQFWEETGQKIANRTLWITTFALTLSFATWFVWSAAVVNLDKMGFQFTIGQKFWLAAIPGLAGGTLRFFYSFLILKFGTRPVVTISTASMIIPSLGLGFAVQDPHTSYSTLLILAALAGFGGGNFSSFMPSTSLFFPRALQGTALGVQAGIGNFGVSLVQFLAPIVIMMPLFGSLGGAPHVTVVDGVQKAMWLQNAGFIWVIPCVICTILCWWGLRSLPIKRPISQQFVIFGRKHTYIMLALYIMSFGSFSGLAASFPLLINKMFGSFPNAPKPLTYAFIGALIGAVTRPPGGFISDKVGGGLITFLCAVVLAIGSIVITFTTAPTSAADFMPFFIMMLVLFFAAGIANGSTFQQIPFIFPPSEAGPVLGFTSAIAAYGSFVFPMLFGWTLQKFHSPNVAFYIFFAFFVLCIFLSWWYYTRPGCEKSCKPVRD